jgi:hypothetical protein
VDVDAAELVLREVGDLTVVPLAPTLSTWLRAAALPLLRSAGPVGARLADQAVAHGEEFDMRGLGRAWPALPDDLLNFQYDAAACAVAVGWPGAELVEGRLRTVQEGDLLRTDAGPDGRPARVVTAIDGEALHDFWLRAVRALPPWS